MIQEAEAEYSRSRLHAVGDEWFVEYPGLVTLSRKVLNGDGHTFRLGELSDDALAEACVEAIIKHGPNGKLLNSGQAFADDNLSASEFRRTFISTLYKTGVVGIKAEGFEKVSWAEVGVFSISPPEITDDSRINIHPAFWRALGIVPPVEKRL